MTATQKIKREFILAAIKSDCCEIENESLNEIAGINDITAENVDDLYSALQDENSDWYCDFWSEFRSSGIETKLPAPYSRHYESKSVAQQLSDGSWVGWVYWYGGGKHGEPDGIDWMSDAYDLDVTEEERLVVVREFKRSK